MYRPAPSGSPHAEILRISRAVLAGEIETYSFRVPVSRFRKIPATRLVTDKKKSGSRNREFADRDANFPLFLREVNLHLRVCLTALFPEHNAPHCGHCGPRRNFP